MQRRSFLRNAACAGTCASLFAPFEQVFAGAAAATRDIVLKLECLEVAAPALAPMQLRVAPQQFAALSEPLRVRAWFATDAGAQAFDLASFGRQGASQRLRFTADTRRLIGFELARGQRHDDCASTSSCRALDNAGVALGSGRYRLSLRRGMDVLAALDLRLGVATT